MPFNPIAAPGASRDTKAKVSEGRCLPVSVVIPAYNRADMLGRALESVAAQRPSAPAEVIVVDDASSDNTARVAEASGVRVIRHECNRGEGAARNTGIEAASQPWIALLDSDDEWLPHHLDVLWQLRGEHVLVAAAALTHDEELAVERFTGLVTRRPAILRSASSLLYPHNFVGQSATMVKRRVLLDAGGYRTDLRRAADLELLLRVLEHGTGIATPRVGAFYHQHRGQVSGDRPEMRIAHWDVSTALVESGGASSSLLERIRGTIAWDDLRAALAAGQRPKAFSQARLLVSHPQRVIGLLGTLAWRGLARRRTRMVSRRGITVWRPRSAPLESAVEAVLLRTFDLQPVEH